MGYNLTAAAAQTRREFAVISRSDSTLRGHLPGEVAALSGALDQVFDGWIINPFFLEGGRYTVNDVHYVDEGGVLVPAAQTEFARDRAFGYASSNLRDWVAEGRFPDLAYIVFPGNVADDNALSKVVRQLKAD